MRRRGLIFNSGSSDVSSNWWENYMTIEALEDGLTATLITRPSKLTLEYSLDGKTWTTLANDEYTPAINTGERVAFRGNGSSYASNTKGIGTFNISHKCNLLGNCMSLLYGDNAIEYVTVPNYSFSRLFYNNSTIISVADNFLPATMLAVSCYYDMFYRCTSLTTAPELPATTLAAYCYENMFYQCDSLTTAPELPATTLVNRCYYQMFCFCEDLTTAPSVLPATKLAERCYQSMFAGTGIINMPELPATTLANYCYLGMFAQCEKLKGTITLPAKTMKKGCYQSMFRSAVGGGVSELPATTLAESCYSRMFEESFGTTTPYVLPATTLAPNCYEHMFDSCSVGIITLPAITLVDNCYSHMFYNNKSVFQIRAMFITTPSDSYTNNWVYGVKSTGGNIFIKNANATWDVTGTNGIPEGWTVLTETP